MHVAVFGTGPAGRHLVEAAVRAGHGVVALVDDGADGDTVEALPRDPAVSVRSIDRADDALTDCDAVVVVAGYAGERREGFPAAVERVVDAAETAVVSRVVLRVGVEIGHDRDDLSIGGHVLRLATRVVGRKAVAAEREAIEAVRSADVDWTVVRTPRQVAGDGSDEYDHGYPRIGLRSRIEVGDVAEFVLDQLDDDAYVGEMPVVTD